MLKANALLKGFCINFSLATLHNRCHNIRVVERVTSVWGLWDSPVVSGLVLSPLVASPQSSSQQPWQQPGLEPLTFSRSHQRSHLLSLHPSQHNSTTLNSQNSSWLRSQVASEITNCVDPSCHTGSTFFSDGLVFAGLAAKTVYAQSVQCTRV